MGSFASRSLNQDITYWAPSTSGETNDFGHPIFSTPTLIKGHWQDKVQQIRKSTGVEVVSMAEVHVDRDVDESGYLALGDFTEEADPESVEEAREIQTVLKTADLRNLDHERRAFL